MYIRVRSTRTQTWHHCCCVCPRLSAFIAALSPTDGEIFQALADAPVTGDAFDDVAAADAAYKASSLSTTDASTAGTRKLLTA